MSYVVDEVLNGAVGGRQDPSNVGDDVQSVLHVLDALDDGLLVDFVVQVGVLEDTGGERRGDGHAASRHDTSSEVLAESHGVWVTG